MSVHRAGLGLVEPGDVIERAVGEPDHHPGERVAEGAGVCEPAQVPLLHRQVRLHLDPAVAEEHDAGDAPAHIMSQVATAVDERDCGDIPLQGQVLHLDRFAGQLQRAQLRINRLGVGRDRLRIVGPDRQHRRQDGGCQETDTQNGSTTHSRDPPQGWNGARITQCCGEINRNVQAGRRPAQYAKRCTMGSRRPNPKALPVTFRPGGA